VHRSYLHPLTPLLERGVLRGLAHVTGGGLVDNLPRIIPAGVAARVRAASWEVPNLFRVLQREGGVERGEMFRAFNMGVGMVAVVAASDAESVVGELRAAGESAWIAGEIVPGEGNVLLD
jgi:phosphoribosylformylglycinamidine cyclo-ligase